MFIKIEISKKNIKIEELLHLYLEAGWADSDSLDNLVWINKVVENSFCFVVAICDNKIVGMGRAISDGVSDAYIQDVVVLKSHRNLGIGKQIIKAIVNQLTEHNIDWISLVSEPEAVGFYQKLNFKELKNFVAMKL